MKPQEAKSQTPLALLVILFVTINQCNSNSTGAPILSGLNIFDLHPNTLTDIAGLSSQWTVTGLFNPNQHDFMCDTAILGGPGILQPNAAAERLYTNLPSHNFVAYVVRVYFFGNWQYGDYLKLFIDGTNVLLLEPRALINLVTTPPLCSGYSYCDGFEAGRIAHTSSSLNIKLASSVPSNTVGVSFGLRGIRFAFSTVGIPLAGCLHPRDIDGIGCGCHWHTYPDSGTCLTCSSSCAQCTGPTNSGCYACEFGYYFDGTYCLPCTANCILCSGPSANQCSYCASGYRLNRDNTCSLTTDSCPSPYVIQTFGSFVQCNAKCHLPESVQYTYHDNSCSSTCDPPFTSRTVGTAHFCDGPCLDPSYFYYPSTQLCKPTCPYPYQVDGVNFCIIKISQEDAKQLETITDALTAGAYGVPAAASVLSILNSGNPAGFGISMLAEILQYIKYMKIAYPPKLQSLLDQNSSSITIIPQAPDTVLAKLQKHEMPEKFEQYEPHSSFLVNFWQEMFTLVAILVGGAISSVIASKTKEIRFMGFFWQKMKRWLKWNFFLMMMTSYFGDVIINSSLEFRTYQETTDSNLSKVSLAICVITNIFTVLIFAKMVYVIVAVRKIYDTPKRERYENPQITVSKKWEDYSMLYDSYKENSIFKQGFFIFFILRVMIFYAVIAYLFDYPLAQSILISSLSLITLLYIVIVRPFKQKIDLITNIIQELLILTVNISTMTIAIIDISDALNFNARLLPGNIIIYCNIAFNAIGSISMIIQIIMLLWNIYEIIKSGFIKNKKGDNIADVPASRQMDDIALEDAQDFSSYSSPHLPKNKSRHNLHSQRDSPKTRLENVGPVLLPNGKVKKIKKPTALPKAKLSQSKMVKKGNKDAQKQFTITRIYNPDIQHLEKKKDNIAPRNLYEMQRNESRSQSQHGSSRYNK